MLIETALEKYPIELRLKDGSACSVRPLESTDEPDFLEFFQAVPEPERLFIKHRVTDPAVIRDWCQNIDLGRNLPLLAVASGKVIGASTLHQQLGGWRRHIGRVSVLVHPACRGRGLAKALVTEALELAQNLGLEKIEAEFLGEQEAAIKIFSHLGFRSLLKLSEYVKDMQTNKHDYVLMGMDLETDEEYAGVG